jgi:hypothetical protein
MYSGPVPTGQQRPHAFVATPGLYASPSLLSGPHPQPQQPLYQQASPDPRMEPLARHKLGSAVAGQLLQHHGAPPAPTSVQDWVADSGAMHHTTP